MCAHLLLFLDWMLAKIKKQTVKSENIIKSMQLIDSKIHDKTSIL